jgi:TRAP-type transport system small permease protein
MSAAEEAETAPFSLRPWRRNPEEIGACVALVAVIASVCWAVITRYGTALGFFNRSATWAPEVAAAAFAWLVFLGAAAAFKRNQHLGIDLLTVALPETARGAVALLVHALMLPFLAYCTWLAWVFAMANWDNPTPSLRMPYALHYGAATVGFALMTLRYAQNLLRSARAR